VACRLHLPSLSVGALSGINDVLSGFGWAANPADVTGYANSEAFPDHGCMINEPESARWQWPAWG
jgi:hypothetical protein